VPVALDARVGRLARRVASDEGSDHVTLKLFGVIEDVVINTEGLRDAAGVIDIRHGTAPESDAPPTA